MCTSQSPIPAWRAVPFLHPPPLSAQSVHRPELAPFSLSRVSSQLLQSDASAQSQCALSTVAAADADDLGDLTSLLSSDDSTDGDDQGMMDAVASSRSSSSVSLSASSFASFAAVSSITVDDWPLTSSRQRLLNCASLLGWDVLWSWGQPALPLGLPLACQRINHFPNSKQLTRKDCLHANLSAVRALGPRHNQVQLHTRENARLVFH